MKAIGRLEPGDVLVVTRLDRLARSTRDLLNVIAAILDRGAWLQEPQGCSSGAKYAIDSKITRAVRDLAGRFEHRLFLSATPHNGHSNSFSALLEILDPNRFCRGVKVRPRDLDAVMVRRVKDDIRELEGGFPKREVVQVDIKNLPASAPELLLSAKLDAYREMREARLVKESPAVHA